LEHHVTQDLTFGLAETEADRQAVFRLRCAAIVESGWIEREAYPDGVESDEDDDEAVLVVARVAGEIVGTIRVIVEPSRVEKLLEEALIARRFSPDDTLFCGRLTVERTNRFRSWEVILGLYAQVVRIALERGAVRLISFAAENAIRYQRFRGVPLKIAGPPRIDTGVLRWPVVFDAEVLSAFARSLSPDDRRSLLRAGAPTP
jgi:N-acyl-L-homoserine lactone synthetase